MIKRAGHVTAIMESGSVYENARAYSYMACSLLKLFTRSVQNYSNSLNHTRASYRKFYGTDFPIHQIVIPAKAAEAIHF